MRREGYFRAFREVGSYPAVLIAEHLLGIPERTSYERKQKLNFKPLVSYNPAEEAEKEADRRACRIAAVIQATSGLPGVEALDEGRRISNRALCRLWTPREQGA